MLGILTYVFNFEIYPIFDKKTLEKLNKKIEYSYLITEFSTLSGAAIEADDQKIIDLVPNQSSSGKSYILDMENKSNSCPIDV